VFCRNGVLFIHIPKTGGTSVIDCLARYMEITPKGSDPLGAGKHGTLDLAWQHRDRLGADAGSIRKVITLFRNPYDRLVSLYYFSRRVRAENLYGGAGVPSVRVAATVGFVEWLAWLLENDFRGVHQYENYITLNGELPERLEVFFYEDIPKCFNKIMGLFGVSVGDNYAFPHSVKTPHPPWRGLYDAGSEAAAYELSKWTFDSGYYERLVFETP